MLEAFRLPFMQAALASGCLIAAVCAYLGVFLILKRMVFVGVALSEIAAVGIALGLLVGMDPYWCAFTLVFIGVLLFWFSRKIMILSQESLIGFAFACAASLSILLVAKIPMAEAEGLNLLEGNLLFATSKEILFLAAAGTILLAIHLVFFRKFLFCSFDRDTSCTMGINADLYDFLIYTTIGAMIAISMKIAGVIFVFASMIIPALTGLVLSRRIVTVLLISVMSSIFCVFSGVYFSYIQDLPTGPSIVGVFSILFLLVLGLKSALQHFPGK